MALPALISIVFFIPIMVLSNRWHEPTQPKLPHGQSGMIVGYWHPNIVLFGGSLAAESRQLQQYDTVNNAMIDNGTSWLPVSTEYLSCSAQCYTQLSNILFTTNGDELYAYDLATNTFQTNWNGITISPQTDFGSICLSSGIVSNSLFFTGGYSTGFVYYDAFQILNISSLQWILPTPPSMKVKRSAHACIVHNDTQRLYAIAGVIYTTPSVHVDHDTIEYIDISDINNIQSHSWQYNAQALVYPARQPRAVVYLGNIFVVGGLYDDGVVKRIDRLQIINTITGDVTTGATFYGGVSITNSAPIIAQDILYWFGGITNTDGHIKDWQYYFLGHTSHPTEDPTTDPSSDPTTNPTLEPTIDPTSDPTFDPTTDPTTEPTNDPTFDPTSDPTFDPTSDPTSDPTFDPTSDPTFDPTTDPTNDPTNDPTSDPTFEPTFDPTNDPTTNPTADPTNNPSVIPTQTPMMQSSATDVGSDSTFAPSSDPTQTPTIDPTIDLYQARERKFEPQLDDLARLYQTTVSVFAGLLILIGLAALIDAKKLRINDYFKIGAILSFLIQTIDMISDCFFVAQINIENKIEQKSSYDMIFAFSILFIVLPAMIALFQLYFYAKKHWLENDNIRSWLSKFSTILLLLSIITGSSFAAVALLNSYIFQLDVFDMGLTQKQLKMFNTKRVYSIVIVENLPQLCLQSFFIWSSNGSNDVIAISSIVFSIISIIVSILSMTMEKTINFTQSYTIITMNITGDCVRKSGKECRTICKKLKQDLAILIGVDNTNTEIIKPTFIAQGFMFKMHIYVKTKSPDSGQNIDYEKILNDSNDNGNLAKIVKEAWDLSDIPKISDIKSQNVESKQERINSVEMLETQISVAATSTVPNTTSDQAII